MSFFVRVCFFFFPGLTSPSKESCLQFLLDVEPGEGLGWKKLIITNGANVSEPEDCVMR